MNIWRLFSAYGVVVDVYIPKAIPNRRPRFAFVRYRYREEQRRALNNGNNMIVEGRQLIVCTALERKIDRLRDKRNSSEEAGTARTRKEVRQGPGQNRIDTRTDSREGPKIERRQRNKNEKGNESVAAEDQGNATDTRMETVDKNAEKVSETSSSAETVEFTKEDEVNLEVQIPEEDMEWLFKSAVAQLVEEKNINQIQMVLVEGGLNVQIRRINGLKFLLTFESETEMKRATKYPTAALMKVFSSVIPWVMAEVDNSLVLWVQLEEVPLELWHLNFFRALGNQWGEFLELDGETEMKQSFHKARMKLLVRSKSCIPSLVVGKSLGVHYRILVSAEEERSFTVVDRKSLEDTPHTGKAPMEEPNTVVSISKGDRLPSGHSSNNGWDGSDDSLTFIMGTTATTTRHYEPEVGGSRLHHEEFFKICMAKKKYGEVDGTAEMQATVQILNYDGLAETRVANGLREITDGPMDMDQRRTGEKTIMGKSTHMDKEGEVQVQPEEPRHPENPQSARSTSSHKRMLNRRITGFKVRRGCQTIAATTTNMAYAEDNTDNEPTTPVLKKKENTRSGAHGKRRRQQSEEGDKARAENSGFAAVKTGPKNGRPKAKAAGVMKQRNKKGQAKSKAQPAT